MASKKFQTVQISANEDGKVVNLRLKKWSVTKFMGVLSDVREISKSLSEGLLGEKDSVPAGELAEQLLSLGQDLCGRVVRIVRDSVVEPNLTDEEISDWDFEEFVGVLSKILEMNLTEGLIKNFRSLKDVTVGQLSTLGILKLAEESDETPKEKTPKEKTA